MPFTFFNLTTGTYLKSIKIFIALVVHENFLSVIKFAIDRVIFVLVSSAHERDCYFKKNPIPKVLIARQMKSM